MRRAIGLYGLLCASLATGASALAAQRTVVVGAPTITAVDPAELIVLPGGRARFEIQGSNLGAASALHFYAGNVGIGQIAPTWLTSSIVSVTATRVVVEVRATAAATEGSSFDLKLIVGESPVALPNRLEIGNVSSTFPAVARVEPDSIGLQVGSAAPLTLHGANLEKLTSVFVRRNGATVSGVTATLGSGSDPTRRTVTVTTASTATTVLNLPLDLVVSGSDPRSSASAPVRLNVVARTTRINKDDLFGPMQNAIGSSMVSFASCGATASVRRLKVNLASYAADVDVPRLEYTSNSTDLAIFLEAHTLEFSDLGKELLEIPRSGHPSPVPHTVSSVRLCVVPSPVFAPTTWSVVDVTSQGGVAQALVQVHFDRVLFRARGMPADPIFNIGGETAGIGWGDLVTDAELPDLEYSGVVFEFRIPLTVSGGRIIYNSNAVEVTRTGREPWWSSQFLGPTSVKSMMENHARDRMNQFETELLKALTSSVVREGIATAIQNNLQTMFSITGVLTVTHFSGNLWDVAH